MDGVLTDGTFWWGPNGEEWKRFSFRDIMGVSKARKLGIIFALISGEDTPLVDRYANKMGIQHVFKGCKDKATAFREFGQKIGLPFSEIAFMGDDVNDLEAMKLAGFSAAPADAHASARKLAKFKCKFPGGNGAVRELLDHITKALSNEGQSTYTRKLSAKAK